MSDGRFMVSGLQGGTQSQKDVYLPLGAEVPNRKRVNIYLDKKGLDSMLNRLHGLGTDDQVENLNTIEMMQYLSTKAEAGRVKDVNKRMPLSQVQTLASERGVPVLTMMGALKNEYGITIYQD